MLTKRSLLHPITKRALAPLLGGQLLLAQAPIPLKSQDHCHWLSPTQLLFIPNGQHPSGPATLEEAKSGQSPRRLPSPPQGAKQGITIDLGVQSAGSDIYFLRQTIKDLPKGPTDGAKPRRTAIYEWYRFDLPSWQWEPEPSGRLEWAKPCSLFMISPDRLLGVAVHAESFRFENRSYPFAIFRRGPSGDFEMEGPQEAGLEKPAFRTDGTWAYPWMGNLWIKALTAQSGDTFLLGTGFGLFWCFDQKGGLRRMARLYKSLDEATLLKGLLWEGAVLGVQPKANGEFLVSALDEEALIRGHLLWKQTQAPVEGTAFLTHQDRTLTHLLGAVPRVDWYVFSPWDGTLREELPPSRIPSTIKSSDAYGNFNWAFKADGNLRIYSEEERLKVDPKALPFPLLKAKSTPSAPIRESR